MPELTSLFRPDIQPSTESATIDTLKRSEPIEVPIVALTPAQQRLKEAREMLEQAQQMAEDEAKQQAETPSAPGTSDELFYSL